MTDTTARTHEQIRAMLDNITQGEWDLYPHEPNQNYEISVRHTPGFIVLVREYQAEAEANWRFIAAAPQIIRQLLDEIERLTDAQGWAESYAHFCEVCARSGEQPDDFETFRAKMLEIRAKR